jgi:hypothetical protein
MQIIKWSIQIVTTRTPLIFFPRRRCCKEYQQLNDYLQPTFQTTCAISFVVFTASTSFLNRPSETTSSSSYGINTPGGVRLMPDGSLLRLEDDLDACRFWSRSWATAILSLQVVKTRGSCRFMSILPSSKLSLSKIRVDGFNSRSASFKRNKKSLSLF